MSKYSIIIYLMTAIFFLMFAACSDEEDNVVNPAPTGNRPEITSVSSSPSTVNRFGLSTLTCDVSDADGDPLTITWSCSYGDFPDGEHGVSVIWRAPNIEGDYMISVRVSDGVLSATDQLGITVSGAPKAGAHGYVYRAQESTIPGARVCIDGTCVDANQNGYYVIYSALAVGEANVSVSAVGYESYSGTVTLVAGDNERDFYLNIIAPTGM